MKYVFQLKSLSAKEKETLLFKSNNLSQCKSGQFSTQNVNETREERGKFDIFSSLLRTLLRHTT
jgi:hypothetical protein